MYNKQEIITVRRFAESTSFHMQQLIKALDTIELLGEENQNLKSLSESLSIDLQNAQKRIEEDEATIQFKDNQLKVAAETVSKFEQENIALTEEISHQNNIIASNTKTILNTRQDLKREDQ